MSNYTLAVNWSGKDALSDSDTAKVVSGSDFNTEFTTVQTAVNSKANLNGDSNEDFEMDNGTAKTQSSSDNSTKIATTAYVTTAVAALDQAAINNLVYPVGSIYTTISATAPATLLGMGTWEAFGAGKVPVGIDASDTDFDTVEETGGAKTDSHTLTTGEIPAHSHDLWKTRSGDSTSYPYDSRINTTTASGYRDTDTTSIQDNTGGGGAHTHDIVQPYIVVYMYKRTA
jgi:hypothetical protein